MLYARLNDARDAFEPQRNLITSAFGLDGGGSVAADDSGRVYVAFHGCPDGASGKSEAERRVFVARSDNDGAAFAPERPVSDPRLGACGCCGLKAFTDARGDLWVLFRAAENGQNRDMMLLHFGSVPEREEFPSTTLDRWRLSSCPMTTAAATRSRGNLVYAWETAGNVVLSGQPDPLAAVGRIAAPGEGANCKHPSLAIDAQGRILLAWTEGMTWGHEGTVHWQVFSADGKPIGDVRGQAGPVPAWSLVAAIADPDGSFTVIY